MSSSATPARAALAGDIMSQSLPSTERRPETIYGGFTEVHEASDPQAA